MVEFEQLSIVRLTQDELLELKNTLDIRIDYCSRMEQSCKRAGERTDGEEFERDKDLVMSIKRKLFK